jgi:serine/threonine-protein kinase
LYVHNGTLFAVPFDLDRLEASGDAAPVVDSIASTPTAAGINGTGQFAVSNAGTLVYLPGTVANERISPIEWIDRMGNVSSMRMMPSLWHDLVFAPDSRRLAITIDAGLQSDVWIYDWARDTMSRLTFDGAEKLSAAWTPDGRRIAFATRRLTGESTLYWQHADGTGEAQRLTMSAIAQVPTSWHPSGRFLAFVENTRASNLDIFILPMEGDETSGWKPGKPIPLVNGPGNEVDGIFSPDGRWIAYSSTESGQSEVYVRPFPGPGGRWQLSTGGGAHPAWSRARHELFYETFDEHVMVVPYTVNGESLIGEKPHLWSDQRLVPRPGGRHAFDVHPDGERIAGAVARETTTLKQDKVVWVSRFFDELRALAPVGKR